jgi:archaellum component FlaC
MTPKHSCTQVEEIIENTKDIKVLYSYREEDMKVIKDLSTDVKDIKKFIFEG